MIIIIRPGIAVDARRDLEERIAGLGCTAQLVTGNSNALLLVAAGRDEGAVEAALADHPAVERFVSMPAPGTSRQLSARRSFLGVVIGVLTTVLAAAAAAIAGGFFLGKGARRARRDVIPAGTVDDFDKRPWRTVEAEGTPVLVVRTAAKDYRALASICTHSEVCQVEWDARRDQVVCPCHRAAYDVFGNVLHGPPPRPLRTFPVAVIDGRVYVKTHA